MTARPPDFAVVVHLIWQRQLLLSQLVAYANYYEEHELTSLAIVLYQTWLARNTTAQDHFVRFNLGVALFKEGEYLAAESAYRAAIETAPDFYQPRFNLGMVLERQGRLEEALAEWRWLVEHANPQNPQQRALMISAFNSLGRLEESLKRFGPAHQDLQASLMLDPRQPDVLHHLVFIREKQCIWPVLAPIGEVSAEDMLEATSALALISLTDDPQAQLRTARTYIQRKLPDARKLPPAPAWQHEKIRIAYCSSDFCLHPVAMLTAELFELHDRERFEVYGFCWSPEDGSSLRNRVRNAFDHFFTIGHLTDQQAAELIRSHEIDILVDLHGQTKGARLEMLAFRPAPIQITYLGLPATTGFDFIDYVIADRYLIPEELACYYSEKPLYLPDVYQVSDRKRQVGSAGERHSCGLPDNAFVFCSLNNNHKYTADVFAQWMQILHRVPDSVLWLLADNAWAKENLCREAEKTGIDRSRLVFADRVAPEIYLARYALADLFLDTFPFNAGTTANDALWMGLPVLTLSGRSFASRMAGALLTAAGLPELIACDSEDYVKKAVELAMSPEKLNGIKARLNTTKETGALFDSKLFTRNLEAAMLSLL